MDYHFNQQELLQNIGINERTTISLFKAQHNITIKTITNIDYTNQNQVWCEPIQNCSLICNKNEPWPYDFSHDSTFKKVENVRIGTIKQQQTQGSHFCSKKVNSNTNITLD